jgi:putative transposase
MTPRRAGYLRHRFPPEIISYAVWVYHRRCLSFRDVEDLLAERGILVSYETGSAVVPEVRPRLRAALEATTRSTRRYVVSRRGLRDDQRSAAVSLARGGSRRRRDRYPCPTASGWVCGTEIFRRLLRSQRQAPCRLVTDKLGSYRVAHQALMPFVYHDTALYANDRAEVSHQPTRQRIAHTVYVMAPPARIRLSTSPIRPSTAIS